MINNAKRSIHGTSVSEAFVFQFSSRVCECVFYLGHEMPPNTHGWQHGDAAVFGNEIGRAI